MDIGVLHRWRHHDDGAGRVGAHQVEIGGLERVAPTAYHPGVARVTQPVADQFLHLDPIDVGQDGHTRPARAGVRLDQLGQHDEGLLRPAEQDRVILLDDAGAALAQDGDPGVQTGGQHPDQRAHDEDAPQRDQEHQQQVDRAALVPAHGAGVHRAQQAPPEHAEPVAVVLHVRRSEEPGDGGDHRDQSDRRQTEQTDQGRRTPRHEIVEPVPHASPPTGLGRIVSPRTSTQGHDASLLLRPESVKPHPHANLGRSKCRR